MKALQRELNAIFRVPKGKRVDPQRKARELGKKLAQSMSIEVERLNGGGFNVWPPKTLPDEADPFHGDHYAVDWIEVYDRLTQYEKAIESQSPVKLAGAEGYKQCV